MIDGVNVRLIRPEDRAAHARLAALDSAPTPLGAWLLAEVEGELWAAVPLAGGPAVADPFHHTADLVELLQIRASQMRAAADPRAPAGTRRLGLSLRGLRRA